MSSTAVAVVVAVPVPVPVAVAVAAAAVAVAVLAVLAAAIHHKTASEAVCNQLLFFIGRQVDVVVAVASPLL